ncbi:MAG TPA: methyltransferase domain-containing protein [Anaeromyxobacteraceae bacterium]|nr:methyltransferase domain-containing protein [Anaeromyxobacteraceae bacterium]
MPEDAWNPDRYARFRSERSRPFHDLLALVRPRPGMRVADLGCGSGELTALAHRELAARETVGIDSSAAMLERAAPLAGGGLTFRRMDIADFARWGEAPFDLVLSNAALHWLPDHPGLLGSITAALAPGGQLAVQVPANHAHPSHRLAHALAAEEPFAAALGGYVREISVLEAPDYAVLLHRLGYRDAQVRLQVYVHELGGVEEVVEWLRGTLLTDYERRLPGDLWERYLSAYRERLAGLLGPERPYLYTYPRILFCGSLP